MELLIIETLILKGLLKAEDIHSDKGTDWETVTALNYLLIAGYIYISNRAVLKRQVINQIKL